MNSRRLSKTSPIVNQLEVGISLDDSQNRITEGNFRVINTIINANQQRHLLSNEIQLHLIEMGFDIPLVNNVLMYFELNSIEVAVDYLSKSEGKWNHPFVKIEVEALDQCLVCNESSVLHRINFFQNKISQPTWSHTDFRILEQVNDSELERDTFRNVIALEPRNSNISRDSLTIGHKGERSAECCSNQEAKVSLCNICLSELTNPYQAKCSHIFCQDCIKEYIKNQIYSSQVEEIYCPEGKGKCNNLIQDEVINSLLDDKDIANYYKFLNRAKIAKIPNAVFCPILDCNSYALAEPSSVNTLQRRDSANAFLTCIEHNHAFCITCKQNAHPGMKCDFKTESDFKKWTNRKDVRNCPKCQFYIQKNEGCNHMTCANKACHYQFCWICMNEYNPRHYTNPLLPCYGMQYTNQRNIIIQHPWLRIIILLLRIVGIIIVGSLALLFVSWILVYISLEKIFEHLRLNYRMGRCMRIMNKIGLSFFLGIALIPAGYILILLLVVMSPFAGLVIIIRKKYHN